jgi:hypothetical protein
MDPITASGVITIGKELLDRASNILPSPQEHKSTQFSSHLTDASNVPGKGENSEIRVQELEQKLKADLLKDPLTANFFQQNQSNQIFLEKRADGSVQFVSSSGQSLILDKSSTHCSKANQLFDFCYKNQVNLTALRPNAVTFNS